MKKTFGSIVSVVELVVAVTFILRMFCSEGSIFSVFGDIGNMIGWISESGSASFIENSGLAGPVTFLVSALGFMLFSLMLMTIVPKMIDKREKEFDIDIE